MPRAGGWSGARSGRGLPGRLLATRAGVCAGFTAACRGPCWHDDPTNEPKPASGLASGSGRVRPRRGATGGRRGFAGLGSVVHRNPRAFKAGIGGHVDGCWLGGSVDGAQLGAISRAATVRVRRAPRVPGGGDRPRVWGVVRWWGAAGDPDRTAAGAHMRCRPARPCSRTRERRVLVLLRAYDMVPRGAACMFASQCSPAALAAAK